MGDEIQLVRAALSACGVEGTVSSVRRLSGKSHISFRVERAGEAPVAVRIEPQRGILPPYDLPSEARLLQQLKQAGIPVPTVLGMSSALDPSAAQRRGCLVVEWVDGEVMNQGQMRTDAARAYCETLRRIHTLDWREAGLDCLPLPPESGPAMREREEIAQRLQSFGVYDQPHIRRLREALEGRRPNSPPPMLVHGDVNFGNFILRPGDPTEVGAALDWEQAQLGDPLSDWGRLEVEDLLGNLDLSEGARQVMSDTLASYGRDEEDLQYWTLHQLYKRSSATGALTIVHGWGIDHIAQEYAEPTERLLSQ
ncbi:MAG: phosphotransferase family protein [Chloroflexi bacterium]|nr:phosphotransferase family protein [Chloroflexota bacterium]